MQPPIYSPASNYSPPARKSHAGWIIFGAIIALILLFGGDYLIDSYRVLSYQGDPRITQLATGSGMSLRGQAIFYSKSPELVSANQLHEFCPLANDNLIEYGCYHPVNNQIYILDTSGTFFAEAVYTTAAHEMLHAAWESLGRSQKEQLAAALQQRLAASSTPEAVAIKDTLKQYQASATDLDDEVHAFVGSELPDDQLDSYLSGHFDKYFTNRQKTLTAKANFNHEIELIEADIDQRTKLVKAKEKELQQFEASYLAPFDYYFQQNLYYQDYTTYNQNVASYNQNVDTYNQKSKEYKRLINDLNADIKQYNEMFDILKPDKKLDPLKPHRI